jgi:RNA polymerase primary sigma factor
MEVFELEEESSRIAWLLDEAGEQGYLTADQILETFPEVERDLELLENLFVIFQDRGITVHDDLSEIAKAVATAVEETGGNGDGYEETFNLSDIPVSDTLGLYLREMSHVPLLTHDEEVALAERLEQGREARQQLDRDGHDPQERARLKHLIAQGEEARAHLISANTRLVVSVAKRYRGLGLPFLDLIQAGNVGLIKATDGYDYRRGFKFATYATWWIRQAVTRALTQQGRTIRIPVHMNDRIRRIFNTAQRLEQRSGRQPTPEEIGNEIGMDPRRVRWLLRVSRVPTSLEKPVSEDKESALFGDFIEDTDAPSPVQSTEQHLLREDLAQMLANLTPREARILRLRFGLRGDRKHSLEEIGGRLGLTRERIRQIERKALRKLRHLRHRRKLRYYLG